MQNEPNTSSVSGHGGSGRGYTFTDPFGRSTVCEDGDSIKYPTRMECIKILCEKMGKYPASRDKVYNENVNYTGIFNSWLMSTGFMLNTYTVKNHSRNSYRQAFFEIFRTIQWDTCEGVVMKNVTTNSVSRKDADNKSCHEMFRVIWKSLPKVQIDIDHSQEYNQNDEYYDPILYAKYERVLEQARAKMRGEKVFRERKVYFQSDETEQGEATQLSDKQHNTIITRDQAETKSVHSSALDEVENVCSTEEVASFEALTQRWMPLPSIKISTGDRLGTALATYYLPESLYKQTVAPNLVPFESYIYGRFDIEIRLVANANKFCCGKVIMSSKYDSYQADEVCNGYQSALARNHVIVDLSTNNEGLLEIPFRYHRPYVRLIKNDESSIGVRSGKYCSVYIQVLSPLQTGADGASEVELRAYYRFKKAQFAGMSYRATVQMMGLENIITPTTTRALKEVLVGAERAFDQLGRTPNQDKPGVILAQNVVPRPRLNFAGGVGACDIVPLRINPHTLTNYKGINCPTDEPKTFYELARVWGIRNTFKWSKENAEGSELLSMILDPTIRSYVEDYKGEPTPLEYACSNFAFWSGTIELRFDFVSNMFHTGTVQITAEFGRKTASSNEYESSSTYTKNFHLGEQKSVSFRVPYIYDTLYRRSTDGYFNPYSDDTTSDNTKNNALSIAPLSHTRVKVKVMNVLRPAQNAPQEIDVLTFMRAGPNFSMHGLKANANVPSKNIIDIDEFPKDGYKPEVPMGGTRPKRSAGDGHKYLAPNVSNEWNEKRPECLKFPVVQMDNGEKEDQDPTENFAVGLPAQPHLTLDSHITFKDLLRRPTLLMWQAGITGAKNSSYFIPLQPPTRQLCATDGTNKDWCPTLRMTTAVSIMDMFRCWRGSMRYTIVATDDAPIYVSLIPHSGTRMIGERVTYVTSRVYPLCGGNFVTEILVPKVNPTMTVEVPYDSENTWSLSFDEDAQRNYSWRDKGDYNSGHLALTTTSPQKVSIWWSAGDDFEISNFYGIPEVKNNGWAYRWDDTHARVQMEDFPKSETLTKVMSFSKRVAPIVTRAAISAIPFVGTPLVIADTITKVEERVNEVSDSAKITMNKIGQLADYAEVSITEISTLLSDTINKLGDKLCSFVGGTVLLYDFLLDLLTAWLNKSWTTVGIAFVRVVTKIIPSSLETVISWGEQIAMYLRALVAEDTPRVQVDEEDRREATIAGLLVGFVGTLLGVSFDTQRRRSIPGELFSRFTSTSGVSYLVQILRFVQATFKVLRDLIMEALGYVSPEAKALQMLSAKNETLNLFVREAQIITSESNVSLMNLPQYRLRVWKTILQAHQIQRLMIQVPTNAVSNQLGRLCSEVIKYGNEKFMDLSASPVRFEPMVLCIEGPAGIGKSHATEDIVSELLTSIGFSNPSVNNIYYRVAGEKFWSGYRDQPVIVYDEWINTNSSERNIDQIIEFMKLKSTSMFIPEMAHLEEKKIKGNPLLVIMLCNKAFPNISDYAKTPEAVYRRRDILLRCERTDEYQGVDLTLQTRDEVDRVTREKPHLKFSVYKNAVDSKSMSKQWADYRTTLDFLKAKFVRYYAREKDMVKRRMEALPVFAETIEHEVRLEDPFTLFYGLNSRIQNDHEMMQNAWTPYEQLEVAVNQLDAIFAQAPEIEPQEYPENVTWETLPHLPTAEGWPLWCAGFVFSSPLVAKVFKAGRQTIRRWLYDIPVRTRMGECCVCLSEIQCGYVCGNTRDNHEGPQHLLCLSCQRGGLEFGNGTCPMCRDTRIVPLISDQDMAHFSLLFRARQLGLKTMDWVITNILEYYHWRQTSPLSTFYADLVWGMIAFVTCGDYDMSLYRGLNGGTILNSVYMMGNYAYNVITQAPPDWEDEEVSEEFQEARTSSLEPRVTDRLHWVLNQREVNRCCVERKTHVVCMHHLLVARARNIQLCKDAWRLTDPVTRRMVSIPTTLCQNCSLNNLDYEQFIEQWAVVNSQKLRGLYIDYINAPDQFDVEMVPKLYRPDWMTPEVEPPLTNWWDYLSDVYSKYRNFILYSTAITSLIATLVGIYSLANRFVLPQYSGTAVSPDISPRHRRVEVRRGAVERRYFQSSEDNPTLFNVVEKYVVRNTMRFIVKVGEKEKVMYGTGLFNNVCLIPKHYVGEIRKLVGKGYRLEAHPLMDPQLRQTVEVQLRTFVESDETDLAYIRLPPKFPLFKDLRKFCALESDFDKVLPANGVLVAGPRQGADYVREVDVEIFGVKPNQIVLDINEEAFELREVLWYNYSQPGACGSLLLRENSTRPILSMHVAGAGMGLTGEGFGVMLTQEALEGLAKEVVIQLDDVSYDTLEDAKFILPDNIHLRYLGSKPPSEVPYVPTKSKLVKSAIHGVDGLEVPVEPAILSVQDPRYLHRTTPLYEGIKKHGQITQDFTSEQVSKAKERLWDGWLSAMKPTVAAPRRLTIEEAVVGFDIPYYKGIDLATSAGYPYMLSTKKTKGDYISVIRDDQQKIIGVESIDEQLLRDITEKEGKRREGVIPHTLFIDTLKDEKRKKEKVNSLGGTRVFCNSPLDYVIACRQNFMHFIAAYMDQRHNLMHAIGINPTSTEWTRLTNALLRKNSKFVTIDYSNFGPGYNSMVSQAAYELMIRWVKMFVSGVDETELTVLVWECIQSMHICNNTVYQQFAGSPSGAVFTTVVNTLVNQLYLLIAWDELVGKDILSEGCLGIKSFKEAVALYTYGDDAIMAIDDKYLGKYNATTITDFFRIYGIVATDAGKTGTIVPTETIKTATFLKRGFKRHPYRKGEWLSPLGDYSIRGATQWVWSSANLKESTLVNCNAALLQAHGHGPEYYQEFKNAVNRALLGRKIAPTTIQWGEIDELYYTTGLEMVTDDLINYI
ncbi:putative polyprotein [Myrmica rubra picorna-like virus 11]|nr:putative polyprotein [Myrmica rubra picorna-like virus 11]